MERREKSLRVANLNLVAAQDNGQIVVEFIEGGLVFSGADDDEVRIRALMECIGCGHGDAQCGKTGSPAEVAHQSKEGFDLLPCGRSGDDDDGLTEIGPAGKGKPGVCKEFKIG